MSAGKARATFLSGMRDEMPVQSFVRAYLSWMSAENAHAADGLLKDLVATFSTDSGLRVLKLLEKSVLLAGVPNGASDGALREMNAVRNFVIEIRGLVANG